VNLTMGSRLGDGAFADVYRAVDEVGRNVAVKIVRPDDAFGKQAIAHAKALAVADHPNVVKFYTVERVADPEDSTKEVTGIVMELVDGQTLSSYLNSKTLTLADARGLGLGVLNGINHLVDRGIPHGDLHTDNVMISEGGVKVIDILLVSQGIQLSAGSFEGRLRRDLLSLRLMLLEILKRVKDRPELASSFNDSLDISSGLAEMLTAFEAATTTTTTIPREELIDYAIAQLSDEAFVDSQEYAQAIAEDLPREIYEELLSRIMQTGLAREPHLAFLTVLWRQCTSAEQESICKSLGALIDQVVPKGNWSPALRMLKAFGKEGWRMLPARTQIRLENAILKDILNGYYDIFSPVHLKGGALGTWVNPFHGFFRDRSQVVENLIAMLGRGWYTQNYVGEYLLMTLPVLLATDEQTKRLIEGVASALANNARIVQRNAPKLPAPWLIAVRRAQKNME
jgi:serine/threonine-protein kinase RIO1